MGLDVGNTLWIDPGPLVSSRNHIGLAGESRGCETLLECPVVVNRPSFKHRIDHVAIGSDFDGGKPVKGLEDASRLPDLAAALLEAGLSRADVRKVFSENALRVPVPAAVQRYLTQGCLPGSLYAPAAYGTVNTSGTLTGLLGNIFGFTSGADPLDGCSAASPNAPLCAPLSRRWSFVRRCRSRSGRFVMRISSRACRNG